MLTAAETETIDSDTPRSRPKRAGIARTAVATVAALGALIGTTAAVGVATAPPAAAAGCYGSSCTGRDPVAMGCAGDAVTLEQFTEGFRVELRYSRACNATWARATGTTSSSYRAAVHGFHRTTDPYPYVTYATGTPTPGGTYSLMISFGSWVKACREYYAWGWSTQRCTRLR